MTTGMDCGSGPPPAAGMGGLGGPGEPKQSIDYSRWSRMGRDPACYAPKHHLERLNLQADRVIPTHHPADDRVITLAEIRRMVGRSTS